MIRQHQPPFNVLLKDDKRNCEDWGVLRAGSRVIARRCSLFFLRLVRRSMYLRLHRSLFAPAPDAFQRCHVNQRQTLTLASTDAGIQHSTLHIQRRNSF